VLGSGGVWVDIQELGFRDICKGVTGLTRISKQELHEIYEEDIA
jgi:hypothetical protein